MVKRKRVWVGEDYLRLAELTRKTTGVGKRTMSDREFSNIIGNFIFEEKLHPYIIRRINNGKRRGFF